MTISHFEIPFSKFMVLTNTRLHFTYRKIREWWKQFSVFIIMKHDQIILLNLNFSKVSLLLYLQCMEWNSSSLLLFKSNYKKNSLIIVQISIIVTLYDILVCWCLFFFLHLETIFLYFSFLIIIGIFVLFGINFYHL